MSRIMDKHPEVYSPPGETAFFECVDSMRRGLGNLADPRQRRELLSIAAAACSPRAYHAYRPYERGFLDEMDSEWREEVDRAVESIWEAFPSRGTHHDALVYSMEYYARQNGKARWAEKTPGHIYYLDLIRSVCPDARIVHMIRDQRFREGSRSQIEDAFLVFYDPFAILIAWLAAIKAGRTATSLYGSDYVEVRFEDLVGNPEKTLRRLCETLDLNFDEQILKVNPVNPAYSSDLGRSGFNATAVGRWRSQLSVAEQKLCGTIVHGPMSGLGYEMDAGRLSLPEMVPFAFGSAFRMVRRLGRFHRAFDWRTAGGYLRKQIRRTARLLGPRTS